MSETKSILAETAGGMFANLRHCTNFASSWGKLAEAGFISLLVREADGGFGGDWGDAFVVLRLAGLNQLPLPVGEAIAAAALIAQAGLGAPSGLTGIADNLSGDVHNGLFTGFIKRVPWGRQLAAVVSEIDSNIVLLQTADAVIFEAVNIAGEPRDTLRFDKAPAIVKPYSSNLRAIGAFVRVAQAAGALDAALTMTIEHVNNRQQFGKPLSKLQAVQQSLAAAACETAAVNSAGQAAAMALDTQDALFELAAAKLRTNQAIGICTGIFHQVHGAIGFTEEYPLHHLTQRLMSWRSEFGGDRHWSNVLGKMATQTGEQGFWQELTRRSDNFERRSNE